MKSFGITILVLLALAAGSGCIPVYYSPTPLRPMFVSRPMPSVTHRCPGYTHHLRLTDGRWLIHRLAVRPATRQLSNPVPQGTPGAYKTMEPDWGFDRRPTAEGAATTQPTAPPTERLNRLEQDMELIGRTTTRIFKIVKNFRFDDQPPPSPAPAPTPADE